MERPRNSLSDFGRQRYELGQEPVRGVFNILGSQFHTFEELPDPDSLPVKNGMIEVAYIQISEIGSSEKVVLLYDEETPEIKDYIKDGLDAMQDHNTEHKKEKVDKSEIIETNKKVLPYAFSRAVSHRGPAK